MFQTTNQLCRYSYMHVILHFQCFISIFIYQVWTISSLTGGSIKIKTATVVNHWYSGKKDRTTDNRSNYFDGVLLFYPFRAFLCIFIRIVWICETVEIYSVPPATYDTYIHVCVKYPILSYTVYVVVWHQQKKHIALCTRIPTPHRQPACFYIPVLDRAKKWWW